jgi:NADH-quinone oxidoreductase subunit J
MFTNFIFYFLSVLALYGGVMVLLSKKPIHSVLYLTLTFFAIGGHYILLNAQFLAIVHIIVYAGAIMVLFLFTVMLLNLNKDDRSPKPLWLKAAAIIAGIMLGLILIGVFRGYDLHLTQHPMESQIGLVKELGKILYRDYMLPFEVSSVLFLTAMIGAVLLGKKEQI